MDKNTKRTLRWLLLLYLILVFNFIVAIILVTRVDCAECSMVGPDKNIGVNIQSSCMDLHVCQFSGYPNE